VFANNYRRLIAALRFTRAVFVKVSVHTGKLTGFAGITIIQGLRAGFIFPDIKYSRLPKERNKEKTSYSTISM
jgi:pyruvate/oxaloacetate carboxyltransferase